MVEPYRKGDAVHHTKRELIVPVLAINLLPQLPQGPLSSSLFFALW